MNRNILCKQMFFLSVQYVPVTRSTVLSKRRWKLIVIFNKKCSYNVTLQPEQKGRKENIFAISRDAILMSPSWTVRPCLDAYPWTSRTAKGTALSDSDIHLERVWLHARNVNTVLCEDGMTLCPCKTCHRLPWPTWHFPILLWAFNRRVRQ